MSNAVLIIGESGTGKSTAIRTLPHDETFIINVLDKPLPFRGGSKKYVKVDKQGNGNYFDGDNCQRILDAIAYVNNKRSDIKYLVIDDFGYVMMNEFMRRAHIKGFDKFVEIAEQGSQILNAAKNLRSDLFCFITMHSDVDNTGRSKPKTVGKLLDDKVCIEGMFTFVLHSLIRDGQYYFLTNHDGNHMAKSSMECFTDALIPNDLKMVADTIIAYNNEDIPL